MFRRSFYGASLFLQDAPIPFVAAMNSESIWTLRQIFSEQYHVNSEQFSFDKYVETSVRILLSCIFKTGNSTSHK